MASQQLSRTTRDKLEALHSQAVQLVLRSETEARKTISAPVDEARSELLGAAVSASSSNRDRARKAMMGAIVASQRKLSVRAGLATEQARHDARAASEHQLATEIDAVNRYITEAETGEAELQPEDTGDDEHDAAAGHQAGVSIATAFGSVALGALVKWRKAGEDPRDLPQFLQAPAPALIERVEVNAVTQALDAYNDQLRRSWEALAPEPDGENVGLPYGWRASTFHVWTAILDRKTCAVCGRHDGEMTPVGQPFESGDMMPLHPRCRCELLTVTIPEFAQARLPGIQLDYQALKADVAEYFRNAQASQLGRRHFPDYLASAAERHSPRALTDKFHSRRRGGYLAN